MKNLFKVSVLSFFVVAFGISGCATLSTPVAKKSSSPFPDASKPTYVISGQASWYGRPFHGRTTANGEKYNMYAYTAAHKTLPFGTRVVVFNPKTNKSVIVRINDRGPYIGKRVLDLSYRAALDIDMTGQGVANVVMSIYPPENKEVFAQASWKKEQLNVASLSAPRKGSI